MYDVEGSKADGPLPGVRFLGVERLGWVVCGPSVSKGVEPNPDLGALSCYSPIMEHLVEAKADFVARGSRGILLFCMAAVFLCCGVCLHWLGAFGPIPFAEAPQDVLERGVITVGALIFGGSGLVCFVEMFRPPRELNIGPQGVYWSDWAEEVIPWSEITRVAVRDKDQSRWFVLQLRDGSIFQNLYPRGRWRRLISRANRVWYRGKL
ncbi:hypothetical protein ACLNGM_22190 [Aureimonas phyllosphaerae]|uniref:hypothetical protein n=1 Tax=Aureimonas phyllosphaerae TaxID=1166078 RepID=UPI003A5C2B91